MNGYKLLDDACRLLGLEGADDNVKIIGRPLVNAILGELGFAPIDSLSELVGVLSSRAEQALLFGTAMLIAGATGDETGKNTMSELYGRKRAALKGRISSVKARFPGGGNL